MLKRMLVMLLSITMIISLCACQNNKTISMGENNDISGLVDIVESTEQINDTIPSDPSVTTDKENNSSNKQQDDDVDIANYVVANIGIVDLSNYNTNIGIVTPGEYTLSGSLENGIIYVKTDGEVVLNLDGVAVDNSDGPCIFIRKADKATINLIGDDNSLFSSNNLSYGELNATIYSKDDLEFIGNGSLNIQSNIGHGIKAKDNLIIKSGTYTISATKDCVNVNDDLMIDNGTFALSSSDDEGLQSETNLTINDGVFEINTGGDGIRAEVLLMINGGNINIINSDEGIESKCDLSINDGNIRIYSIDDGINAINTITINGGDIYVVSETNDALDGNEKLIINGGHIYAVALLRPEGATDTANDGLYVNGGTLIGLGAVNTTKNLGTQATMVITPRTRDIVKTIEVKSKDGRLLFRCDIDDYVMPEGTLEGVVENIEEVNWDAGRFSNLEIGVPSFYLSWVGMANGTYDIYINGIFNETIVIDHGGAPIFGPIAMEP